MKWANPIKYKIKAAFIFAGLTALLLLANLLERNNVADLNKTMTSMRNDRLLPATFAYQIDHLLYENKLLLAINKSSTKIKANMDSIEIIAKKYEATVLTPDEAAKWTLFRSQLKQVPLIFSARNSPQQAALQEVHFNQLLLSLDQLVQIQVSESARLMDNGKKAVSSHILLSNLVAGLCLIFGLVTLVLLSLSHYSLHKPVKGHMLN